MTGFARKHAHALDKKEHRLCIEGSLRRCKPITSTFISCIGRPLRALFGSDGTVGANRARARRSRRGDAGALDELVKAASPHIGSPTRLPGASRASCAARRQASAARGSIQNAYHFLNAHSRWAGGVRLADQSTARLFAAGAGYLTGKYQNGARRRRPHDVVRARQRYETAAGGGDRQISGSAEELGLDPRNSPSPM